MLKEPDVDASVATSAFVPSGKFTASHFCGYGNAEVK
jgi:hypothetical protein